MNITKNINEVKQKQKKPLEVQTNIQSVSNLSKNIKELSVTKTLKKQNSLKGISLLGINLLCCVYYDPT